MTKFIVNNRTDVWKTDVNLFLTITDCQIVRSRLLTQRINYKFICLSAYWRWKLANERAGISAVIVKNEIAIWYKNWPLCSSSDIRPDTTHKPGTFKFCSSKAVNSLPASLRFCDNIHQFNRRVKIILKEKLKKRFFEIIFGFSFFLNFLARIILNFISSVFYCKGVVF